METNLQKKTKFKAKFIIGERVHFLVTYYGKISDVDDFYETGEFTYHIDFIGIDGLEYDCTIRGIAETDIELD